ncbi:hypothetical protein C2845_PM18G05310 [Panicum miliaceum]|uniref:Uncharacterized protein n=1 Tax=Panicum miliaceum TaxID=4540 RepID=A0A3L6PIG2_PANMI|nr:hypothetical protein C2845_PM18G05310 [Panicum miliaceum]
MIHRRLLAVCWSVSRDLRAVVDGRGLLAALVHRVPRGLRGIFVNYVGQDLPYLFSRPERATPGNGHTLYVCNPATRRWARLPPRPGDTGGDSAHLVFNPTVSLHYEVISFSEVPRKPKIAIQPGIRRPSWCQEGFHEYTATEMKGLLSSLRARYDQGVEVEIKGTAEWPPSSYMAQVFSSRTGRWEERTYVREGDVLMSQLRCMTSGQTHRDQIVVKHRLTVCVGATPYTGGQHSTSIVMVVSS